MRSLREPLLEAELNKDRKSALWLYAAEIMVGENKTLISVNFLSNVPFLGAQSV